MTIKTDSRTLASLLPSDLTLGAPQTAGALSIHPLLGSPTALPFLSFAEASAHGCVVKELEQASVNNLLVINPLDVPVLLFEGEEVKGAQQDRTFDITVLVPAGARVTVPVSCVEHGRWDGSRHAEPFSPSPNAAFPALRAAKNLQVRVALACGVEARADQSEVWQEVERKRDRMDVDSSTGAMGDIYRGREHWLVEMQQAFARVDGQLGALVCIAGQPVVVDYVGRPDVFAALWQPLLRGYCLDALEHDRAHDPDPAVATAWLDTLLAQPPAVRTTPHVGLGHPITCAHQGKGGSGLVLGDAVVQLSVFAEEHVDYSSGRVLRPSRRS